MCRCLRVLAACALIVLLIGVLLPSMGRTNHGGNGAALTLCSRYARAFQSLRGSSDEAKVITLESLATEYPKGFSKDTGVAKLTKARFLVRKEIAVTPNHPRVPVIVCDRAFDNVPMPTALNFYRKNPAHAVGYSDGTTGLISEGEYQNLDLSGFVDAEVIFPPSSPNRR